MWCGIQIVDYEGWSRNGTADRPFEMEIHFDVWITLQRHFLEDP